MDILQPNKLNITIFRMVSFYKLDDYYKKKRSIKAEYANIRSNL